MSAGLRIAGLVPVLAALWLRSGAVSARGSAMTCVQPPARDSATMSAAGNGWTYLYEGPPHGGMWRWSGTRWVAAANLSAPAISSGSLAPDITGAGLILLGVTGTASDHSVHLGMWRWRNGRWQPLHPTTLPSAGFFTVQLSMAPDRAHHLLLLAETVSDANYRVHNELWSWNGTTWRQLASDGPNQITGTTVPNEISTGPGGLVYGFQGTIFNITRLVRWTGNHLEAVGVNGSPVAIAGVIQDPRDGSLLVLGGPSRMIPDTPFPTYQTDRFDGSHWTSTALTRGLRNWIQMLLAADPKHTDVLLWGGQRSYGFVKTHPQPAAFPATWRWSGGQWREAQAACG